MLKLHVDETTDFDATLEALATRGESDFGRIEPVVREILAAVRAEGDAAVSRYAERFDRRRPPKLLVRDFPGKEALARLPAEARASMELATDRIRRFHERQKAADAGFRYTEDGITLGVRISPVTRAGVYAPGGKARYPSSVLMSAVPAQVAGVAEIYVATPLAGDASDDSLYAAAYLSGVTAIVDAGGAQAIAAMAYGTQSVPRVDKVVGPGNLYVACAKRFVFGAVDIDSIAGPSEILVCADESADPRVVAADLLSQAEHDEAAYPLLVTTSAEVVDAVERELETQLAALPREAIARVSVTTNGHAFVARSRERMGMVADRLAAEHLSLQVRDPHALLALIPRAGAAFVGHVTPEAAGDYLAGPSHVLPTGGAVRFGSPLGVYDFVTRTSIIEYSAAALAGQAKHITDFARLEALEAHARAVEVRLPRSARSA
jgi:histidinol dehydrogenase